MEVALRQIRYPIETPPETGEAIEIAEGILWFRVPLPMALDHVNVYALDEGDSWSIVDTGIHSRRSVALWESVLAGPLAGKPVGRVILTHHHPDHVGMAGWLMDRFGAGLTATRTSWLMARMLILDEEERPTEQALKLWRAAGMDPAIYDARKDSRPFNFADTCHALPVGYTRVKEGGVLRAGGRNWDVITDAPSLVEVEWTERGGLLGIDADGRIWTAGTPAGSWEEVATGPAEPETLMVDGAETWWVASAGGRISRSDDAGDTWVDVYVPPDPE